MVDPRAERISHVHPSPKYHVSNERANFKHPDRFAIHVAYHCADHWTFDIAVGLTHDLKTNHVADEVAVGVANCHQADSCTLGVAVGPTHYLDSQHRANSNSFSGTNQVADRVPHE